MTFLKINKKIIIKDYFSNVLNKKENHLPWLVWFSGLSATLQTKGSLVRFPARTHAWVAGQVPSRGHMSGNHTLMFLSLSSFLPLSLKINKSNIFINLKKKENHLCRPKRFETLPLPLEKFINDQVVSTLCYPQAFISKEVKKGSQNNSAIYSTGTVLLLFSLVLLAGRSIA